ncbi:MAG: sugar phosphate isomerase/epimerase [Proteobacteria bacterium]|nr:sugar phosphate isomerase/epimerase [Pseudomonadota bacterium]
MTLGYSTNAFVHFSLEESVNKIAGLGFKGIEIMCDQPHLYPPEYGVEDLKSLSSLLKIKGLHVTNLNSFTLFAVGDTYLPSWIETEKSRRDIRIRHTLECLHVASFLDCANISVPPGGPLEPGMSASKAMALFYKGLEEVIPVAEQLGVKILVEPEPDLLLERTGEFKNFIKDIRSPNVGINFDIGHFFCAGEDPARSFEILREWVGHVHIEDIGTSRIHQHLVPGDGAIDLGETLETMASLEYNGHISLELYPYINGPEKAGQKSLEYLIPLFQKSGLAL